MINTPLEFRVVKRNKVDGKRKEMGRRERRNLARVLFSTFI
jgi:hypothetical protein